MTAEWGEVKLNVPTAAFYLEGPPTSMWIQLGDGTYIQKLQKQLTSISKKSRPISHTFNDKPKVRKYYYLRSPKPKLLIFLERVNM